MNNLNTEQYSRSPSRSSFFARRPSKSDRNATGVIESGATQHQFMTNTFSRPTYCNWCSSFMWGISKQGLLCIVCNYACHRRCLDFLPPGMRCVKEVKIPKSNFIHYQDEQIVKKKLNKYLKFNKNKAELPTIVKDLLEYLEQHALKEEGLFRVSAPIEDIKILKKQLNKGAVDLSKIKDIHVVSGALKLFFRELPDPIFTYELYDTFLAAVSIPELKMKLACLKKALHALPIGNETVLKRLFGFLFRVAQNSSVNRMTSSNLAVVFGPTLLSSKNVTTDHTKAVHEAARANSVILLLIENYPEIFEGESLPELPSEYEKDATVRRFNKRHELGTLRLASRCVEEEDAVLHLRRSLNEELDTPGNSSSSELSLDSLELERPRTPNSLRIHEGSVRASKIRSRSTALKNIQTAIPHYEKSKRVSDVMTELDQIDESARADVIEHLKIYLSEKLNEVEDDIDDDLLNDQLSASFEDIEKMYLS